MRVVRLALRNFRNIGESEFEPDPKLNFLLGKNGQGKTSFLEALGLIATLRSFRGSKSQEVLKWGETHSEISCLLSSEATDVSDSWQTELKTSFHAQEPYSSKVSKTAFINGKAYKSSTQYLSQRFGSYQLGFHAVVFNPSDHDLVRGEPSVRRSYLDRVLAAESAEYLRALQTFQRVLVQRNSVLKTGDTSQRSLLQGFTEPLASLAAFITRVRLEWILNVQPLLNHTARQIAENQPVLSLFYLSNWIPKIEGLSIPNNNLGQNYFTGHGALPSLELLEQEFWKKLSSLEAQEWRIGHSLVGPHRDDWSFFLGDQVLKGHGSQGEVRSALLALKLSEIEQFQNATGHRPVFLLDDFSSELDRDRRSFLLRYLSETKLQVFVTTTELIPQIDSVGQYGKKFWVSEGSLRKEVSNTNEHGASGSRQ